MTNNKFPMTNLRRRRIDNLPLKMCGWLLFLLALAQNSELKTENCSAQTPVEFDLREMTGSVLDRAITIKPLHNPIQNGTNIYWLPAAGFTVTTSNGVVVTNLIPNDYSVTIAGVPAGWAISVPDTNVVVNAVTIATNLTTYAYTSPIPGVYQLVAGAGIGLNPANGAGTVTITATGGAGGALAAGTNAVVWTSGGTNYVAAATDTNIVNVLIGAMTNSGGTANLNILGEAASANSANAVSAAVTNGIAVVATNATPSRTELNSTMMIFPSWALGEINSAASRLAISGDGGRTFFEPFFNPVYHAGFGNSYVNDNSLCYDRLNDCWWMPYTADATSDNGSLSNKWGLAVFTNLWSGSDFMLVTSFTNSSHSWIDQAYFDANGLLRVILQAGRTDSNTLFMYEQHPTDATYTNWSTPALITGSYTNNFGYDFFLVDKNTVDGTNYFILWKPAGSNSWSLGTADTLLGPYTTVHVGDWAGWIAGVTNTAVEAPVLNRLPGGNWRLHFKTGIGNTNSTYWYSDSASGDLTQTNWGVPRFVFTSTNLAHGVMRIPDTVEQAKIWSQLNMWRWLGFLSPHARILEDYSSGWSAGNQAVLKFTDQRDTAFPVNVGLGYFYGFGFALGGYRSGYQSVFGRDAQVGLALQDVTGMRLQLGAVNTNAADGTTLAVHSNTGDSNALWIPSNNVTLGSGTLRVGGFITNDPLAGASGFVTPDANGRLTSSTSASLLTSGTLPLLQLPIGVLTNNAQGWVTNAATAGGSLALNNDFASSISTNASFSFSGITYPAGTPGNQSALQYVWITNSSASPIVLSVPAAWQSLLSPPGPLTITNASFALLIVNANTGAAGTNYQFIPAGTPLWNGSSGSGGGALPSLGAQFTTDGNRTNLASPLNTTNLNAFTLFTVTNSGTGILTAGSTGETNRVGIFGNGAGITNLGGYYWSGVPTITTNGGAGAPGATVTLVHGNDRQGYLIITPGTSPAAQPTVPIITATFANAMPDTNYIVQISPGDFNDAGSKFCFASNFLTGSWQLYAGSTLGASPVRVYYRVWRDDMQ